MTAARQPLLVELDEATLAGMRGRVGTWLDTVHSLQTAYRRLLGNTVPLVGDPLARSWLGELEDAARGHEDAVPRLYEAFEVTAQPSRGIPALAGRVVGPVVGPVLGLGRELIGQVQGAVGGGHGRAWRNLRQLTLSNLDSMSAFAVAEQAGLALGRPAAVDVAFRVVTEKSRHQLLLRELFLEFAADAVLYRRDV